MTSANLAINGGEPLRSQPFGPKWIFGDEERRHLMEVMDNATDAWRSGFKVRAFADAFATLHGAQYAVATTTGTGAIHAAVAAVNPEPGDEIITTPTTDIGSVLGIILHNAIPVFADWDPETLNTDPADIEHRITPRTRAILVVHLYGNPCDMGPILEIGRAHNLPVIEDLHAAVGLAQFDRWQEATRVRRMTAAILDEVVPQLPGFKIQKVHPEDRSAYYTYAYTVDESKAGISSDDFSAAVRAEGIPDCYGPYIQGRPLYRYPIFTEEDTYGQSRYPFVDEQGNRRIDYSTLHLPHTERELPKTGFILFRNSYTEQDAKDIAAAMRKVALHYAEQAAQ
ncbi:MAG: DegT/DnrJ/EryC1/StrS family aminotransferase [Caldilineaceae bacterium]|nr:DegT/DnrJ/EryC1/StrS family aminotransferase [Caldilineaceae bacterium]